MPVGVFGALLLTSGAAFFGICLVNQMRKREDELWELEKTMSLLCCMLEQFSMPTEDLLSYLAKQAPPAGALLFGQLIQLKKSDGEKRFYEYWTAALSNIGTEARQPLSDFGHAFGCVGVREQCEAALRCRKSLRGLAEEKAERRRRNGRVYIALASAAGALISIVML